LQQRACAAKRHRERKPFFRATEFFLGEQRIRYRVRAEIEDDVQVFATARSTIADSHDRPLYLHFSSCHHPNRW
jgi:hypothetical protein